MGKISNPKSKENHLINSCIYLTLNLVLVNVKFSYFPEFHSLQSFFELLRLAIVVILQPKALKHIFAGNMRMSQNSRRMLWAKVCRCLLDYKPTPRKILSRSQTERKDCQKMSALCVYTHIHLKYTNIFFQFNSLNNPLGKSFYNIFSITTEW